MTLLASGARERGIEMAGKKAAKRLGKKHRQASTRPHKGKAPKSSPVTGATAKLDPRKRKVVSAKKAKEIAGKRVSRRSPEFEAKRSITGDDGEKRVRGAGGRGGEPTHPDEAGMNGAQDSPPRRTSPGRSFRAESERQAAREREGKGSGGPRRRISAAPTEEQEWKAAELAALQQSVTMEHAASKALPLIAICGRPNVGKSTLFNRLTGSRRSIVGDEPGITRDRIYGEIEWAGREVRLVDTGGVVPDDEALIPSEIFRQAQVALEEADAMVMVVDGRTELASPDMELARLLMRGGKPVFLAVNKIDTAEMHTAAENFRRLGFRNVVMISAEHGSGIGDLLDDVFAVLPGEAGKREEGRGIRGQRREQEQEPTGEEEAEAFEEEFEPVEGEGGPTHRNDPDEHTDGHGGGARKRGQAKRTHGAYESRETKIAIIGRPNVGKSTLLNALTGTDRAIVSRYCGDDARRGGRDRGAEGAPVPVRGYGGDPAQGQDEDDGGEAERHHGAEAPGGGGCELAGDRCGGGGDEYRREYRRVCA